MVGASLNNQDFVAELKYRTAEEGGRNHPVLTGYRPHIKFPFSNFLTSAQQTFIDKDRVLPGETVTAYIKIISVEKFQNSLIEGMEFEFSEGPIVIGSGKILNIINPLLKKN
jgi:translation elongation factor EF-Tu-like GTPase